MIKSRKTHRFLHRWRSADGSGVTPTLPPQLPGQWRPGMPCHWMEETAASKMQSRLRRIFYVLQVLATIAYLQFRARRTISIFDRSRTPAYVAYQIFFFALECICVIPILFQMLQVWNVLRRNCVDFKRIPRHLIKPYFLRSPNYSSRPEYSMYPTVAVYIPCYNEDVNLVRETVLGALRIDYPQGLFSVYLCDDGQDPQKEAMISNLKLRHDNLCYVTRPEHQHAKAGNLNYALKRTESDLVITLDADFIPRPNIIQRLMPYYFVWNPDSSLYEFNETLAVVQTPQHFRNLSPHDSDPLDQRSLLFFDVVQHGKDWFNASTMVGTNNLISKAALKEAEYYPYYSVTEDSAMSLQFHSLGYRTYYVNESLATGLATTSLRSNLRQRARWMKGDWQILFSKNGLFAARGLTMIQKLMYFNMGLGRLMSFTFTFFDIASIALLLGGVTPLDVQYPLVFIIYLAPVLIFGTLAHFLFTSGGKGLNKSAAGNLTFETMFRYSTMKGLFEYIFNGENIVFKVTDKSDPTRKTKQQENSENTDDSQSTSNNGDEDSMLDSEVAFSSSAREQCERTSKSISNGEKLESESVDQYVEMVVNQQQSQGGAGTLSFKSKTDKNREENNYHSKEVWKNLERIWFNVLAAIVLIVSVVWGIARPPTVDTTIDGNRISIANGDLFPMAMAIGFTAASALPHLLVVFLCFRPYTSGWMLTDVVHGRCDQFAAHHSSGKLYVPWSYINLVTIGRMIFIFGSITFVLVYTLLSSDPIQVGLP